MIKMTEFLSLCDVLFNVVSLAGYFCDVVFDVILSYALFEQGHYAYMAVVITLVLFSLVISQVLSLRWYMQKIQSRSQELVSPGTSATNTSDSKKTAIDSTTTDLSTPMQLNPGSQQTKVERYVVVGLHCCQMGVLWRYAKLFVPVDLRHVKHEVRDLCMLRLVHAFCEAAPMLLLQLYILVSIQKEETTLLTPEIPLQSLAMEHVAPVIVQQPSNSQQTQLQTFKDLNVVSCTLSLFSVCWALASFSKNVRIQNVHRLVLTWLGVIFQFLWRLGTVISRVASLTVYASVYSHWVFLVIGLHWVSMFLWLISPKNVFHGEHITRVRKIALAALIAFVYVFAYINLQEVNHRQKMFIFYFVMFLENSLLVSLWLIGIWIDRPDNWYMTPLWIFASFIAGLLFMFLYYRYFHVRRLGYEAGGRLPTDVHTKYSCADGTNCISFDDNLNTCQKYPSQIPGVFNCRFSNPVGNGAARRKKKKPTTFVPPPNLNMDQTLTNGLVNTNLCAVSSTGLMSIPFWRRPVTRSHTYGSENEGSAGSRVDIYQKLQEKKQKQLAELKIIEEEIKQGKLGGPASKNKLTLNGDHQSSLPRQPIPQVKKHINIEPNEWRTSSPELCAGVSVGSLMNDLNVISSGNMDDINNLNKYTHNYDSIYSGFQLEATDMPSIAKKVKSSIGNNQRNISPISSQSSAAVDSHAMLRQIVPPRTKIVHETPHNRPYRSNYPNIFAENYNGAGDNGQIMRPLSNSPSRIASTSNSNNEESMETSGAKPNGNDNDISDGKIVTANGPTLQLPTRPRLEANYGESISIQNLAAKPSYRRGGLDFADTYASKPPLFPMSHSPPTVVHPAQKQQRAQLQRPIRHKKTAELMLAPQYLNDSTVYFDWENPDQSTYRLQMQNSPEQRRLTDENRDDDHDSTCDRDEYRVPSDIDSQVSLPRSYTLPREFKYYRRIKGRKLMKNERFITSTNSSDGDVDSGDDNESTNHSNLSSGSRQLCHNIRQSPPALETHHDKNRPPNPHIARAKYPHSMSATASPITVSATINPPMNNLNLANGDLATAASMIATRCTRSASASPNITALNVPAYLNRMPNQHYLTPANKHLLDMSGSLSIECSPVNGSLDIIDDYDNTTNATALNRRMRFLGYGNHKNGMVRHETKL